MFSVPIPVDVRSTAWICTLSLFGAAGSMPPVTWMSLYLSPSLVNVLPYLFFPWTSIAQAEAWAELWFMSNCSVLPLSYARHMPSNMAQLALYTYNIYIYIYIYRFVCVAFTRPTSTGTNIITSTRRYLCAFHCWLRGLQIIAVLNVKTVGMCECGLRPWDMDVTVVCLSAM